MCGFAGIIAWEERFRVTRELLGAMSARIAHRGPDGEGMYLNHEREAMPAHPQCGLVHRRLAILDLDERALQPFDTGNGRWWLAFNGEIYNFRELRDELSKIRPEYRWRTTCDTEVLLLAYEVWGERCVGRFNGMFAFAIWDQQNGMVFLARDRMGQKPLYYALARQGAAQSAGNAAGMVQQAMGALAFASELSALRQLPWVDGTADMGALSDYLCWGYIPAPRTVYRGAAKMPAARWMRATGGGIEIQRYFDPNDVTIDSAAGAHPEESPVQTTRRLVTQAVKRQLVADVPLGCFLSGGTDSSIIAAAMKASVPADQPVLTFAIGFDDPRYDETPYAARVAQHLSTQHQQFIVTPHAAEDLPRLAEVFGEPFADSSALPTHYLSRETRGHVKVALSGDGGDELFGGYERYRAMLLGHRLRKLPFPLRGIIASGLWQHLPGTHPKSRLTRLKRLLATLKLPAPRRYASYMRLFDEMTLMQLLGPRLSEPAASSDEWLARKYAQFMSDRDIVESASALDRITYLPEDLLTKVDRCSMLHALEVRSPFMDHELVHFAASLPCEQLIGQGPKGMLREAFAADLPAEVFRRRKMGFAVPIGQWLRDELRPMLEGLIGAAGSFASEHFERPALERLMAEHQENRRDHSERLYALLMLELWWKANM